MNQVALDMSVYRGVNAQFSDPCHQAVLLENTTYSRNIYRSGTVDDVLFDQAYILTRDTSSYLYSDAWSCKTGYKNGTRVHLEKLLSRVLNDKHSERERALAILAFVRDIPLNYRNMGDDPFHGGTEEEVIRKGSSMCNEQARVLCVMAQMAGIPARYIGHMTQLDFDDPKSGTGHGVAELFIEGAWAYMDIRGIYFEKQDGMLASTWEIISDPSIIERQSEEARNFRIGGYDLSGTRKYFSETSIHIIAEYNVEDHGDYDYSWVYPSTSLWAEARERARALRVSKHQYILPQPSNRF